MTAQARKSSNTTVLTGLAATDKVVLVANVAGAVNNAIITIANLLANSAVPHVTTGNNAVSTANLVLRTPSTVPVNSNSNGVQGQVSWDSTHLYLCVANNSWIRFTGSSF